MALALPPPPPQPAPYERPVLTEEELCDLDLADDANVTAENYAALARRTIRHARENRKTSLAVRTAKNVRVLKRKT